jgi:IS66 Orf2 like protein
MRSIPRQNLSYIGGVITFTPRRVTASSIDSKCEPPDRPVPPGRRTALSPAHCRSRLPDPNSQDPSIAAEPTRCRYLPPAAKCVHRGDCIVGRHTAAAVKTAGEMDASPEPNAVLRWSRLHFLVCYKRLEEERFKWPTHMRPVAGVQADRAPVAKLTPEQLTWLLDGLDLKQLKPHRKLEYRTVL